MENSNRWLDQISGDIEELYDLIAEGEHQQQDFKFRIDSAKKIAITLCAFANTDGGRLLIGVKDNGKITGIDPEEEFYMIEGAANMYCEPPVLFTTRVFEDEESKNVLEIDIPSSALKPHYCLMEGTTQQAFIRQMDENYKINRVIIKYLKDKSPVSKAKNMVAYGLEERQLFNFLSQNPDISLSKFSRISGLTIPAAEDILVSFLRWGIIHFKCTEQGVRFYLSPDPL